MSKVLKTGTKVISNGKDSFIPKGTKGEIVKYEGCYSGRHSYFVKFVGNLLGNGIHRYGGTQMVEDEIEEVNFKYDKNKRVKI